MKGLRIASSLSQPDSNGQLWVRCLYARHHQRELKSGPLIGTYSYVEAEDISAGWADTVPPGPNHPATASGRASSGSPVPEHVQDLYYMATQRCDSPSRRTSIQELLDRYQDVFSKGDEDMGNTDLVRHEIPTEPG